MDFYAILLLAFIVLLSLPQLASLALLVSRRHLQPIRYRGVWLLLVSGVAFFLVWIWHMMFLLAEVAGSGEHSDDKSLPGVRAYFCGSYQWLLWLCNVTIMASYFLRSYRILKIHHDHTAWTSPLSLQQQLNSGDDSVDVSQTGGGNPYLIGGGGGGGHVSMLSLSSAHARKLGSRVYTERYMLKLLLALMVVMTGVKLGVDHTSTPIIYSGFGCGNASSAWSWLAVDLAEIALLLIAIWKLRSIRDDYGISSELITVCVIWVVCSIGFGAAILLRRSSNIPGLESIALGFEADEELQTSVWAVRNFALFFTSITWPLLQSYWNSFPPLWSNCDALCSLETLLKDIVCIQYFRNYLMDINRVEWILCWVEMELFRDLDSDDPDLIGSHARRIYEQYLQLGAALEVHLSPSIVHTVTRDVHVGVPSIHCFEEAQRDLLQFMEAEFPRFLSSPSCEACLLELEKEEVLREVLEKSGMI